MVTDDTQVFVSSGHDIKPFDLAVDTVGRLLFWTCALQNVINVTRLDNSNSFGSLKLIENEKPRLIVIHVAKRYGNNLVYHNNYDHDNN